MHDHEFTVRTTRDDGALVVQLGGELDLAGASRLVDLGTSTAPRVTFEPGWRWSESVKPIAGTDTCQVRHVGVLVSGHLHVVHDDGSELDLATGSAYVIEPGHDAWVVGDDGAVGFEFESKTAATYAKT